MDYLPIQASSVPCERIFSSAAETDTKKRNRISPVLLEALQMLKHKLRRDKLHFTSGLMTPESAMLDDDTPADVEASIDELINQICITDNMSSRPPAYEWAGEL